MRSCDHLVCYLCKRLQLARLVLVEHLAGVVRVGVVLMHHGYEEQLLQRVEQRREEVSEGGGGR